MDRNATRPFRRASRGIAPISEGHGSQRGARTIVGDAHARFHLGPWAMSVDTHTLRPGELGELFAAVSGDTATVLGGRPLLLVDATVGAAPAGVVARVAPGRHRRRGRRRRGGRRGRRPVAVRRAARPPTTRCCRARRAGRAMPRRGGVARRAAAGQRGPLGRGGPGCRVGRVLDAPGRRGVRRLARQPRDPAALPPDPEPPVLVERDGDELRIVLNRPHRHNAVTAALRDGLAEALSLAAADDSITAVHLSGNGPVVLQWRRPRRVRVVPRPGDRPRDSAHPQPGPARPHDRRPLARPPPRCLHGRRHRGARACPPRHRPRRARSSRCPR